MFELILVRHAKSDWDNSLSDIDRPLNDRGVNDATQMGQHLAKCKLMPDTILISAAERTQQTFHLMNLSFNIDEEQINVSDELYLASPSTMLNLIIHYSENNQRLMLLAHNPGMDELVTYLASTFPKLTASGKLMVTCSAAIFQFESLADIKRQGAVHLITLLRPKEIR